MFDRKFAQIMALCGLTALAACGETPVAKTNCWATAAMSFVASGASASDCWPADGQR